jgi:hypothetical protein
MTASAASTIVGASGSWGIFGPRSRMGLCDYMGSCLRVAGPGLLLLLLTSCEAPTERPEGAVSSPVQVGKPQIAPPAKGSQEAVRAQPHARQDVLAAAGQHATSTPVQRRRKRRHLTPGVMFDRSRRPRRGRLWRGQLPPFLRVRRPSWARPVARHLHLLWQRRALYRRRAGLKGRKPNRPRQTLASWCMTTHICLSPFPTGGSWTGGATCWMA